MLDTLARASLDGAIFASIVWILTRTVSCLPAGAKAFLWWCVAAKFLVALVWTTPVSLAVLPARASTATYSVVPEIGEPPSAQLPSVLAAGRKRTTASREMPWSMLILAAWAFGCGISAYRGLGRWRSVRRVVARSSRARESVQSMAADVAGRIGLRRPPDIRMSEDVVTPLVTGLRVPVVLLPVVRFTNLSDQQQRMTLCHELVHLKRFDLLLGWIPALAEPLFFFHPLAHMAVREYLFWREAACDAAVLEALDVAPQEYGGLLLDLGVVRSKSRLAAAGAPWSFSILKRRIIMLRNPPSRSVAARILAPALVGLALAAIVPLQLSARPPAYPLTADTGAAPGPRMINEAQRTSSSVREDKINFVLFFDEERTTMSGSSRDMARAKSLKRPGEPMLWFRMAGREYIVRDPAVLSEIAKVWGGPNRVGDEQGKIGAKQGAIGTKQGEIGRRQGEIGAEQGIIGTKQGIVGTRQGQLATREVSRGLTDAQRAEIDAERRELDRQMKELDREMRKLDDRMRELDAPMRELDAEMRVLDKEMSVLNRRMEEAVKRAEEATREIVQRAIASGAAETVK